MPDKGKQFEYAIMLVAYSNIDKLPETLKTKYANLRMQKRNIEDTVYNVAETRIKALSASLTSAASKQTFYKSFQQLGGGAGGNGEPKTDVVFVKNGKKYRCSLKWGESWQLSSAGVATTYTQLMAVLNTSRAKMAAKGMNHTITDISKFLVELNAAFGDLPKKIEQPKIKKLLESNLHLQDKFQKILGSRSNPTGISSAYQQYKLAVIEEMLTGKLTFGATSNQAADWILVGGTAHDGLRQINTTLVEEIANKTYVRLRLKGRGQTEKGIRLNELVITIEPKT